MIIIDDECTQIVKDLKMAHARDIAKLTRDMRDNHLKIIEQMKSKNDQAVSELLEGGSTSTFDIKATYSEFE